MVVVAAHHVWPAHEYLALFVGLYLDAGERQADRADAVVFGPVRRYDAGLRHAVALQYRHARAEEGIRERGREGRSARDEESQPTADALAPLRQDEAARRLLHNLEESRNALAPRNGSPVSLPALPTPLQ